NDSQVKIRITGKGIERVKKFDINNLKIQPMKTWDAKWRVVIFDIPEKNKNAREMFRNKLKELGFYMIQKSVFVCPWDCVDEIVFLRNILEINPHVSIILAEAIDEEMKLRRLFNVSTF
ncbi:MAG: CRISPR-associated endonuclease Cas2, partial [Patescibacteria group bacterium]